MVVFVPAKHAPRFGWNVICDCFGICCRRLLWLLGKIFPKCSPMTGSSSSSNINTLQQILDQFDQPFQEKTQQQINQHYLIMEKMTIMEIEYLQDCPSRGFVGMFKMWDENDPQTLRITLVPCIVRPEVLFRGFGRN
jgi:hypothetical protein